MSGDVFIYTIFCTVDWTLAKKDDPNTILTIDSEKCILDSNGTLTERFYSVKGEGDAAYLYMNDYYGYPTLEHVDYYTLILAWNKRFSGTYQRIQYNF